MKRSIRVIAGVALCAVFVLALAAPAAADEPDPHTAKDAAAAKTRATALRDQGLTPETIAMVLNQEGYASADDLPWTGERVEILLGKRSTRRVVPYSAPKRQDASFRPAPGLVTWTPILATATGVGLGLLIKGDVGLWLMVGSYALFPSIGNWMLGRWVYAAALTGARVVGGIMFLYGFAQVLGSALAEAFGGASSGSHPLGGFVFVAGLGLGTTAAVADPVLAMNEAKLRRPVQVAPPPARSGPALLPVRDDRGRSTLALGWTWSF